MPVWPWSATLPLEKALTARLKDAAHRRASWCRCKDTEAGLALLARRGADVFFSDRLLLLDAATRSTVSGDVVVLDRLFRREPLALAMRRDDDDFRLLVDRTLSRLYRTQDMVALYTRYFGTPKGAALDFFDLVALPMISQEINMQEFGVHSEVGKLRTVMVCRPGLAHQRLTPGNAADLLFDDVLWVHEAQTDHYDFVLKMRERGTEVLDLHEMLAETLRDKEARAWVLDRRITVNDLGFGVPALRGLAGGDAARAAGRAPDRRHRRAGRAQERDGRRC